MSHADDERSDPSTPQRISRLSDADKAACDRLLGDGMAPDATPRNEREAALVDLLGLIDQYPDEEPRSDLVANTLARIDQEEAKRQRDWTVSPDVAEKARLIRLPDSFAIAAALLLAVSIGIPLYNQLDSRQEIASSQMRQQAIGQAIAGFASDNNDALPIDLDLLGSDGPTITANAPSGHLNPVHHSWSAHLGVLVGDERIPSGMLSTETEANGDSVQRPLVAYRVPFKINAHRFSGTYKPGSFLLGDCNPVLESIRQHGQPCDSGVGANNHGRSRLVVINFRLETSILRSPWLENDGSSTTDNVWVAHDYAHDAATETLTPEDHHDTVLAH